MSLRDPEIILAPALTKGEALSLERTARRHWQATVRNALVFAAELRQLQDGGAHLVRGYDNFAVYAEQTFDGLTSSAAKQLSRQGGVLLHLEQHQRLTIADGRGLPVATTALRALSVIFNSFGEEVMLAVYDRALTLRPGRTIVEQTVKSALKEIVPFPRPVPLQAAPTEDVGFEDEADEDDPPELIGQLLDRLGVLRHHVDDLSLNAEDPILAMREFRNVEEELEQVRQALLAAHGSGTSGHGF